MNASEAKEKVLKVWPDAELVGYFDGAYAIFSRLAHHASTTGYIGWGQTTYKVSSTLASSQAWIDAASRLPEEKEPAPKEGEPAKVESGDALPPLEMDGLPRTWANMLIKRETQLKASLLREKGKDEENERLKGLLREIVADDAFAELCQGIGEEPEWFKKAKAAVTGEQP